MAAAFVHHLADFTGVPAPQLRDTSLITGLMIAAASACGLAGIGAPHVRTLPRDGIIGLYLLDESHITVHTYPGRGTLLLDVVAPALHDPQRAVDVFARRLDARGVHAQQHMRG